MALSLQPNGIGNINWGFGKCSIPWMKCEHLNYGDFSRNTLTITGYLRKKNGLT